MEENIKRISDYDMKLIASFFSKMNRQGPGSESATLEALKYIPFLTPNQSILDVGCGTGSQTLVLAQNRLAKIKAVDNFDEMLLGLNKRMDRYGFSGQVQAVKASMDSLQFEKESFDVIWAEGSIFIMGFENGIKSWYPLLKEGGYIALTEATWLTSKRPQEIEAYWQVNYPAITTVQKNISMLEAAGYEMIHHFVLPESCWLDSFYADMESQILEYESSYSENEFISSFLERQRQEIEMYKKYKEHYGYVFYIARKRK